MEFTDIAMELSKKAWQASFHHPFILQLQEGNLEPAIFRYYLIQDAYYLKAFSDFQGNGNQRPGNGATSNCSNLLSLHFSYL